MEKVDSEYHLALEYLQKSFNVFLLSVRDYIALYKPNQQLKALIYIWNHPRGILNLIRTLSLQFAAQWNEAARLATIPQPTLAIQPLAILSTAPTPLPNIEVANPRYNEDSVQVKVEEGLPSEGESVDVFQQSELDVGEQGSMVSGSGRCYKRGPYKSYSMAEKERAVRLLIDNELPITEISRKLRIPCKNIKRWSTQGIFRRSGGGRRRSSPKMEDDISKWIRQQFTVGEEIEMDRIQEYALAITADRTFKASRGWVSKFLDRSGLRASYSFR